VLVPAFGGAFYSGTWKKALSLTSKEAEGIVAYRVKNGDLKSLGDLKQVPEVDAAKLNAKKNLVVFQ
jgi:DNA uptake protein ComE-like DNA-binding protein